ncbi:hypothetical protein BGW80DRAFT_1253591 [Lactifluus volemus]|nr:hypothetical protein BGW80DRAFT_1253591 [Lactifluus volemus]
MQQFTAIFLVALVPFWGFPLLFMLSLPEPIPLRSGGRMLNVSRGVCPLFPPLSGLPPPILTTFLSRTISPASLLGVGVSSHSLLNTLPRLSHFDHPYPGISTALTIRASERNYTIFLIHELGGEVNILRLNLIVTRSSLQTGPYAHGSKF